MCHEASGRALTAALGTGKGTVDLRDWEQADAIWLMGDNAATNAPRMLTWLAEADRRGAAAGPHQPADRGGVAADDRAARVRRHGDLPHDQDRHDERAGADRRRHGPAARRRQGRLRGGGDRTRRCSTASSSRATPTASTSTGRSCEATPWSELVRDSGVDEAGDPRARDSYLKSERVIIAWCLGVTQHEHGVDTIREIVNLLLLRGNIGREGAGPCPVRGHSNVQGNRTCGIDHRPDEAVPRPARRSLRHRPAARARPRHRGRTIEAMHRGRRRRCSSPRRQLRAGRAGPAVHVRGAARTAT